MRLIRASSSGRRKTRGRGLPGYVSGKYVGLRYMNNARNRHTHLWFWRDTPNLHPAESKVKEP